MREGIKTFVYPVKDLAKAKALYSELLGVEPDMDGAYYVGLNVDGQHVGLDPHGRRWRQVDRLCEGRGRQRHRPRPVGLRVRGTGRKVSPPGGRRGAGP
jgi:catechol 2,3-dioxygenase-like lactoylglutathione lyase family enzyme